MGQQDHSFYTLSHYHYWSTIMRSSRSKMFVYVVVLCVMCIIVFLLSSLHSNMKELETVSEKCQQQRDSLSAQLQVLYEHKSRLDKSLHQEKSDHKRTKEENERLRQELEVKSKQEKTNVEELTKLEKQLSEIKVSYSHLEDDKKLGEATMKEQYQSLRSQKDGEIEKLHAQLNDMLTEKEKLEQTISDNEWKVKQYVNDLYLLQLRYKQMESQLSEVNSHLQKVQHESKIGFRLKKFASTTNNESGNSNLNGIPDNESKNEKNRAGSSDEKKQNISQTDVRRELPPNLPRPNIHPPVDNNNINSAINKTLNRLKNIEEKQIVKVPEEQVPAVNRAPPQVKNNTDSPAQKESNKDTYLHKIDDINNENVMNGAENNNIAPLAAGLYELNHGDKTHSKEINNIPQVQPPNNFDSAGEQGELLDPFNQPAMNSHKQQLEKPEDHQMENNNLRMSKNVMPAPPIGNDAAPPQQQDLLDRPPAVDLDHHKHFRMQHDFVRLNNHNRFNGESHLNGRVDGHQNPDGKQYVADEDDDQDGENEEEQLMGGPVARGRVYQDNDFEDQENLENNDNAAKNVEGVMVAPK